VCRIDLISPQIDTEIPTQLLDLGALVFPVRYKTICTNNVEHMLSRPAPPRAEAIEEGMRLGG
jgi:hypothetical protein